MARIMPTIFSVLLERCLWEGLRYGRRLVRRIGWGGIVLIVATGVSLLAWLQWQHAEERLDRMRVALEAQPDSELNTGKPAASVTDGRERLRAFDAHLVSHEDIPDVLQSLFHLADAENLTLQRGEYKVEPDSYGGFIRYRMILPVNGDSSAVYRFIQAALSAHGALALDSVQFRRERIDAKNVEARIQWILLTRLPAPGKPVMQEMKE